jgi:hypothetical protein
VDAPTTSAADAAAPDLSLSKSKSSANTAKVLGSSTEVNMTDRIRDLRCIAFGAMMAVIFVAMVAV